MTAAQRDRWAFLIALAGLLVICWLYLIDMSRNMSGMREVMGAGTWSGADWLKMMAMWAIMMIAMMVPTAIRAILVFQRIGEQALSRGGNRVSPWWFTLGYIIIWSSFGIAATTLQWALDEAMMLSPMLIATSWYLGALLLLLAGVWQISPWKQACLKQCQSPAMFIARHFRRGPGGAIHIGLMHGAYCIGCCWAIMTLLFLGGVMNVAWIAIITLFILAEKLLPPTLGLSRVSGWLMIVTALGFLVNAVVSSSN